MSSKLAIKNGNYVTVTIPSKKTIEMQKRIIYNLCNFSLVITLKDTDQSLFESRKNP